MAAHVLDLVTSDSDRLADHGNDRTYNIFHCLANVNLSRVITFGCDPDEALVRRRQVRFVCHCQSTRESLSN